MAHQVLPIYEPHPLRNSYRSSPSDDEDETLAKNSNKQFSQKSLLTQALRATSEQSQQDTFQQDYIAQTLLKPRYQDYSLGAQSIEQDELQKFSLRSVRYGGNSKEKILTSFVEEAQGQNKENTQQLKKKEGKVRRENHCSKCEIF